MAIYVLFQCCKCNAKHRLHLYSCSSNKYDLSPALCEHFNIRYSYVCKYGFFTLGWSITLEVKVQCKKCNSKYYNFGTTTFNSSYYNHDNHHSCCYNVFMISVDGYNYSSDGKGLILQEKQRKMEEEFKKQEEEKKKQEEEKRKQLQEKMKIQQEINRQKEEEKEIDLIYNFDTNYIDSEISRLLTKADYKIKSELSFDIEEEMNKNFEFKFSKFEFH